jgi:hypothetical protein
MDNLDLSVTCSLHKTTELKAQDAFQSLERTKEEANAACSQPGVRNAEEEACNLLGLETMATPQQSQLT